MKTVKLDMLTFEIYDDDTEKATRKCDMKTVKLDMLTFEIYDDGTASVTACDKSATSVVIPAKVEGAYVKAVSDNAFENCKSLVSVEFPPYDEETWINDESFEEIGGNAFYGCTALRELFIPCTVATIGHGAFYRCTALEKVTLEDGLRTPYLAPYVFMDCEALKEITPIKNLNDGTFSGCASLKHMPIAEGCDEIPEDCFEHCDSLTEITIPKSVKSIGPLAFRGCASLSRVTFEDPEGWRAGSVYFPDREPRYVDFSDPIRNAKLLREMDFDDGVRGLRKE